MSSGGNYFGLCRQKRKPSKPEERKMLGKAIEVMIKVGMENHIYRFHDKLRIQKQGDPLAWH